jgi:hypothetical protein
MTTDQLLANVEACIAQYRAELGAPPAPPPPTQFRLVQPTENLQLALNTATMPIHLVAGATYPGVTLPSGTRLYGNGANVVGVGVPALYAPPFTSNVYAEGLTCTSNQSSVVKLGDTSSTTQGTLALVPTGITLSNISVPTHRGKRAFEVHAVATLINCSALDVYDPTLADSQGVWIHNTPGPVSILGGTFVAGSENIMIGGDSIKIPGNVPTDILIDGVTLRKPLTWQTDGVNRAVKNLFEVKAGRRVRLLNSALDGSWTASQTGWAIVITPKNANLVDDVLIEDCTVRNAAGLVQLMGLDYNSVTPQATRGVVLRNVNFTISRALFANNSSSMGCLTTMTGGMKDVRFENCTGTMDGQQMVFSDTSATYGQQGPVTITGCTTQTGQYGLKADGVNYGSALPAGSVYIGQELLIGAITGNTFTGAPSQFRTNFPANTYV